MKESESTPPAPEPCYAHTHPPCSSPDEAEVLAAADVATMDETAVSLLVSDCWAKTGEGGLPCLSVQDHCLVVGAVADHLFDLLSQPLKSVLPAGAVALVAAHDVGKLTPGFQLKAPKWAHFDKVFANTYSDNLCSNHAIISQWHMAQSSHFRENKGSAFWLVSTGGHHGRYPQGCKYKVLRNKRWEGGNEMFISLRDELLDFLIRRFGPLPSESAKKENERIHLLTGFTIFSDWIGSNTDWFPPEHPLTVESLQATAQKCVEALRWRAQPIEGLSFGEQFNRQAPETFKARSIQSALLDAADCPGLYIVEAPMGMGKTEAALTAAYQRWTQGSEHGLYFALPTQLTSNKIHERIQEYLTNTIGSETVQTLIHGNAWLKDGQSRRLLNQEIQDENNDTDEALRWYSTTRKQLLAPFGTGTIDQALLAVLPAKFAALRYFALAGKVVVLDEVHAFDPYMSALIDRLIRYLLKAGSTVIVLSATLTARRRGELVRAAGAEEGLAPSDYPLITKVATGASHPCHVTVPNESVGRSVLLKHERHDAVSEDKFWESIAGKVESGANVVVIRNTVALAQDTYRQLRARLSSGIEAKHVGLIHSRYPQNQRELNEAYWTGILGKNGEQRPKGSLLVSTQIVEQSVDIDADCLVTDLAPTELILQRIGRLHRHKRERPKGFGQAVCHIIYPSTKWAGSTKEVKDALAPHHFIYPPLSLWQAAKTLSSLLEICLPDDIRRLLEEAATCQPEANTSPALTEFVEEYDRQRDTMSGTARQRDVFNASAIEDKEGTETRYGIKPSAQLVILAEEPIEQGGTVRLKIPDGETHVIRSREFNFPLAKSLQQHATRIPAYLVKSQLVAAPGWLRQHLDSGVLAIRSSDSTELRLYASSETPYTLHYRRDLGITHEKVERVESSTESEDFWF